MSKRDARQPSLSAQGIALIRALETEKPAGIRVCDDPLARRFVHPLLFALGKLLSGYADRRGPGVTGFLIARCRCIDDFVSAALADGLQQLVIVGAGLDSRAYRLDGLKRIPVFEVDHPASQQVKRGALERVFGGLPAHVVFVPINLGPETLDKLFGHGYDPRLKTLFVLEGLLPYLEAAVVDATLTFIHGNAGPGSALIFDYIDAAALAANRKRHERARMQRGARFTGERLVFGIEAGRVTEFLHARGFSGVRDRTSRDLESAYFTGPDAGRTVAPIYGIASATVGDRPAA